MFPCVCVCGFGFSLWLCFELVGFSTWLGGCKHAAARCEQGSVMRAAGSDAVIAV